MDTAHLIAVARGDAAADLVIEGARVFDAFTGSWMEGSVAVVDRRIAGVGDYTDAAEVVHAEGRHLVPGFIDAHVHIESSKLTADQFARTVVPRGTTAVVAEPHEIGNVLGVEGVEWFLESLEGLPLEVFVMAPSCVPASDFESPGHSIDAAGMEQLLQHPRVLGIGEMMNFPGVIAGAPGELSKLATSGWSHADGHAPGVTGRHLNAYASAGIGSDHESTTWEEALAKRRAGMWVLLREASNARNLVDLLPLVREYGPQWCAFCTDDREPDELLRSGHIDQMCRTAVEHGVSVEDALLLATLHPARAHGLRGHGAIAPGYHANLVLLGDLPNFRADVVWCNGREVARDGTCVAFQGLSAPDWVTSSIHLEPVTADDFVVSSEQAPTGEVRVIGAIEGQLLTTSLTSTLQVRDGAVHPDPAADIATIAVVERHHATGRIGHGFVHGFGLTHGAFASTVAHDAHNIVVVGTDTASMAACVNRMAEIGGGIVVADGGQVVGEVALPVAGLMSERPVAEVAEGMDTVHALLRERGVTEVEAPFMMLSFLALSVIPSLKVTDRGLVDVDRFELVPLSAAATTPA